MVDLVGGNMKPVLFDEDSTSFRSNGLGRLDPISCEVTEERNGVFELEMEIAQTSLHADQIGMNSIILAKPNRIFINSFCLKNYVCNFVSFHHLFPKR